MEKKHIITIAGKPGSGKSTTSKNLAKTLSYTHFSAGDLFRAIAKEHGTDVYQHNITAETATATDEQIDSKLRDLGKMQDNLVIDSRMAWHWIPQSFRVYLDLDLEIAAHRILNGMDEHRMLIEHIPNDIHLYAQELSKRLASESKRYMTLYGQNPSDVSNYNLIIDTSKNSPQQVQELILNAFNVWSN